MGDVLALFLAGQTLEEEGEGFFRTSTWFLRRFVIWVSKYGFVERKLPDEMLPELYAATCTAILDLARDRKASAAEQVFGCFLPEHFAMIVCTGFDTLPHVQKIKIVELFWKLLGRTWRGCCPLEIRPAFEHLCQPFMEFALEDEADGRKAVLRLFRRFIKFEIYAPNDAELFLPWLSEVEEILVNVIHAENQTEMLLCAGDELQSDVADFVNGSPDERRMFINTRLQVIMSQGLCDDSLVWMSTVDELRFLEDLVEFWSQ
jgi:hypothetical protein